MARPTSRTSSTIHDTRKTLDLLVKIILENLLTSRYFLGRVWNTRYLWIASTINRGAWLLAITHKREQGRELGESMRALK